MLLLGTALIMGACTLLFVSLGLTVPRPAATSGATWRRARPSGSAAIFVDNDVESLGRLRMLTLPLLVRRAERNIALSGHRAGWTLRRLMLVKTVAATIAAVLMMSLWAASPSGRGLALSIVVTGAAFFYPDLWLSSRAKERQLALERELPDLLDQVIIAIESGMTFEGALARVGERGSGPLAQEFMRTLQDMRLGMSRRAAYNALADRTTIPDLKRFCKQIIQAEEFGVSTATLVRNLAAEMRVKRRFRAEETAQKLPVKMIFPLVFCFFPVLFVVILFPAFYGIGQNL
ncbi:type II secretion system F family protein [Aeromicrobium sp. CFBP 8757]|uniref:type II secretion system F family protein n=1 Tax=Aeromicrobium sp. CFBP 8757 TaxID=2775288 RepID=UPI00177C0529|nr:type II secretion system F family protein [Aeromicrobium sp. CFBP 8757]MBD8606586.1 type II secretion system F family protein [Aeromicrobium sp. CFBP 8757]